MTSAPGQTAAVDQQQIRDIFERNAQAVRLRPSVGRGTLTTRVRLRPGLECEIVDGAWSLKAGMSPASGGTNAGPTPGILGRGALGSCLAIGYAMWAARLGVALDSVEVEVEADYDSRGELGIADDVPPGYLQVRYRVTVASPAAEEDLRRVIDTADKYSPYRDVYLRPNDLRRDLRILRTGD